MSRAPVIGSRILGSAAGDASLASSAVASVPGPSCAHVEQVVRRSGTSFYWAMRFLPLEKRQAMFAIYAFCREVDDIADEPGRVALKQRSLCAWRDKIEDLYRAHAGHPVTEALVPAIGRYQLRKEDFLAVIDGMEMDAADRIRISHMQELDLYCDRVACAVGRLSVRVFGVPQPTGDRLAGALGHALQLTNILRDLKEDARRDRLYLPADILALHGISGDGDAESALRHQAVAKICEHLAGIANRRFEEAATLMRACDRRQVRPAVMMMEVYRRTLQRLIGRGWARWAEPVSLSSLEKLWVALRHGRL
jgi:phytoene synthase